MFNFLFKIYICENTNIIVKVFMNINKYEYSRLAESFREIFFIQHNITISVIVFFIRVLALRQRSITIYEIIKCKNLKR